MLGVLMKKKPNKKRIINRLDKLFSEAIRKAGKCEASGQGQMTCSQQLQAAHIFSRSHKATRWDLENAVCMCSAHHLFWAHKEPYEFMTFVEMKKGKEVLEKLHSKARTIAKYSIEDLLDIEIKLRGQLCIGE
jgi:hypothetical protein